MPKSVKEKITNNREKTGGGEGALPKLWVVEKRKKGKD